MRIEILLFAGLAELLETNTLQIELPDGANVYDLRSHLRATYPHSDVARALIAVNRSYAQDALTLSNLDEVALIPPVGGGGLGDPSTCRVTEDVLDVQAALALLEDAKCGGTVLFCGTVREFTRGRQTLKLAYEAYEEMALLEMRKISDELQVAYPDVRILQWHRVGLLFPTDIAVVCGAASPHRDVAFEVAKLLIERLKKEVPIWKKEFYEDGETTWQPNEV